MSSDKNQRTQLQVDNRRVRNVYDALDSGNSKKAVAEADKVLRKFPGLLLAKALKSLALIRLERAMEAFSYIEECDAQLRTGDMNESVLQLLCHCYKESFCPERITELLEILVQRFPTAHELVFDLFYAYVRVRDFKNQQRIAMILYKETGNSKYSCWAVCSVMMQAATNALLGKKMLLPLAQKMSAKGLTEDTSNASKSEIYLHANILMNRGLHDESAEFIRRHTGKQLNVQESHRLLIHVLRVAQKRDEMFAHAKNMLAESPTNSDVWFTLYGSLEELKEKPEIEEMIEKIKALISEFLPRDSTVEENRYTGHLVRCNLIESIVSTGVATFEDSDVYGLGNIALNICDMIDQSFDRAYTFGDISNFFQHLSQTQKTQILEFATRKFEPLIIDKKIDDAFIMLELLRAAFGVYSSMDVKGRRDAVWKLFSRVRSCEVVGSLHAKPLTLLFANILWSAYVETADLGHLYDLVVILEYVLEYFPGCYIAALLLIRAYNVFGAMSRVGEIGEQLDLKYVQRDSLGYLSFTSLAHFGHFKKAICCYTSLASQIDHSDRDISEALVTAYRVGNLENVQGMVEYADKCERSLHAKGADLLNQLFSACFAVDTYGTMLQTLRGDLGFLDWGQISDTRDLSVLECVGLERPQIIEAIKKSSFNEVLDYIKFVHLLSRAVSNFGIIGNDPLVFESDCDALRAHISYCKSAYTHSVSESYLQGFGAPAIVTWMEKDLCAPLLELLNVGLNVVGMDDRLEQLDVSSSDYETMSPKNGNSNGGKSLNSSNSANSEQSKSVKSMNSSNSYPLLSKAEYAELIASAVAPMAQIDLNKLVDQITLSAPFHEFIHHAALGIVVLILYEMLLSYIETRVLAFQKLAPEIMKALRSNVSPLFVNAHAATNEAAASLRQKVEEANIRLLTFGTFRSDNCFDFDGADMQKHRAAVDQSIMTSYATSLNELMRCCDRVKYMQTLERMESLIMSPNHPR